MPRRIFFFSPPPPPPNISFQGSQPPARCHTRGAAAGTSEGGIWSLDVPNPKRAVGTGPGGTTQPLWKSEGGAPPVPKRSREDHALATGTRTAQNRDTASLMSMHIISGDGAGRKSRQAYYKDGINEQIK